MGKLIDAKTIKFIFVGLVNTLVGTLVMYALYNLLKTNYWVATSANYIIGSIVSFFLNKYFTFGNKEKSLMQIVKFVVNIVVCYFIAYGIAKPFVASILSSQDIRLQENVAMFVGLCLFTGLNYFGQRFFVFKEK